MTNEEAIEQLKLTRAANKCNYADKYILDALDMAIRSLEAWEEVKEEIKELPYYDHIEGYPTNNMNFFKLLKEEDVLDIIDKHLKEVEQDG